MTDSQTGPNRPTDWPTLRDVYAARRRIAGIAVRTPLIPSGLGPDLLLKLETLQPVGAFKLRGAANALGLLDRAALGRGVTCCSTGNHGRAVAYAGRRAGARAVICLSTLVPRVKVEAIEALGAEVRRAGRSQDDALAESQRLAAEEGLVEISPFDDSAVVAGQATIALELLEDRPDLETIVVPLSGGGLAGGVALAAKAIHPGIRIVGVSMDRGAAMAESIAAGRPIEVEEVASLADSLGGGIGLDNRLTFGLCRALIDEVVLVSEAEIYRGMRALLETDRVVAEGGAAVGAAALLAGKLAPRGPTALLVTGRNVDMEQYRAVIAGRPVSLGGLTVEG